MDNMKYDGVILVNSNFGCPPDPSTDGEGSPKEIG